MKLLNNLNKVVSFYASFCRLLQSWFLWYVLVTELKLECEGNDMPCTQISMLDPELQNSSTQMFLS